MRWINTTTWEHKGATSAAVHGFRLGLYPELMGADNKKEITSKSELKAEADKRGMYSHYVEG